MHQFRNTSVYVRDPQPGLWDPAAQDPDPNLAAPQPVGEYRDIVMRHLDQIRAFPVGAQFFTDLTSHGKRQVIAYIGTGVMNDNSASGSGGGKKKIVSRLSSETWSGARVELNMALAAAHPGPTGNDWLARQILATRLHRWNPALTLPNSPFNPRGLGPGAAGYDAIVAMLAGQLKTYREGRLDIRPEGDTRELLDLIVWILRDHMRDGAGSSCMIRYTPLKIQTSAGARPAQIALFHELMHAFYEAQGKNLSQEDSATESNGRYFELAATGLPPYDTAPYSENGMRALMNVGLRQSYG